MGIIINGSNVVKKYFGTTEIQKCYLGTQLFYSGAPTFDFTTGLVASWQLENNFNDYTGNHNAVATGTITNNTPGIVGNQADFGGGLGYLTVQDHSDLTFSDGINDTPFSISFWVNFDSVSSNPRIVNKGGSTSREWQILYVNGYFIFTLNHLNNSASISITGTTTVTNGSYYNVTVTYDGTATKEGLAMYVNAVSEGVISERGIYTGMDIGGGNVILGALSYTPSSNRLAGKLDEIKIYKNRVLTQAEITEMYTQELAGNSVLP